MEGEVLSPIATLLGNITTFFGTVVDWVEDLITTIIDNPVLLIVVVCIPVCGYAIGYLKRLLRA